MEQITLLKAQAYDQMAQASQWNNALINTQKQIAALEDEMRKNVPQQETPHEKIS